MLLGGSKFHYKFLSHPTDIKYTKLILKNTQIQHGITIGRRPTNKTQNPRFCWLASLVIVQCPRRVGDPDRQAVAGKATWRSLCSTSSSSSSASPHQTVPPTRSIHLLQYTSRQYNFNTVSSSFYSYFVFFFFFINCCRYTFILITTLFIPTFSLSFLPQLLGHSYSSLSSTCLILTLRFSHTPQLSSYSLSTPFYYHLYNVGYYYYYYYYYKIACPQRTYHSYKIIMIDRKVSST